MPKHLGLGKNDEWRTPKSIFDALAHVFDLDRSNSSKETGTYSLLAALLRSRNSARSQL